MLRVGGAVIIKTKAEVPSVWDEEAKQVATLIGAELICMGFPDEFRRVP
ncbi:hypothetical protein GCM10010911_18610 [Paenibacillus nasutitermitis]|uniref:Uncharacterized protein n=1 Tax=Paenibacillus nasutitermitis TaxID=1652958 RepID=A0A916YU33_9BACL|nr:hypothetical protein GCM10010911_18610 [Paenibacillus nasutitermitis]